MSFFKPQRHRQIVATVVYWVLLVYIIAALVYWYTALEKQNHMISVIRLSELKHDDPEYYNKVLKITDSAKRKTTQYIAEGTTFLALIILGAVFVFRATRRQLRLSQQQQNFMMAITHELKTPIAITQLNLETLQKRKLDEEKQQKLIANTLQEANRLNTLCNNILLASQLDSGAYRPARQEINFSDLVEGCIDDFSNRYPQRKIDENITESIYLTGETLVLQILVNNLIENALKYSPKESGITVSLRDEHGKIKLSVTDTGPGIAPEERERIFEKFYRSGNENTRRAKGTGLGLYLCRKIAESHNGYISVTENSPSGSNFTVSFQVA